LVKQLQSLALLPFRPPLLLLPLQQALVLPLAA
jgi:hypothetical protein